MSPSPPATMSEAALSRPSDGKPLVLPDDGHNRVLVSNVHPPDWANPTPSGRYNLVVLGAGEIAKALTVAVHRLSAAAKQKIEAAGGQVEII